MSFPPYQDKKLMIPDIDDTSIPWDNNLPKRLRQDYRFAMAWTRMEWLLSTLKTNGQKCDMQTVIESTFRGEDLFYTNETGSQEYSQPPSS